MLQELLRWLYYCLEVLLPRECLVCTRPLKGSSLCFRCTPKLSDWGSIQQGRCVQCFSPILTTHDTQLYLGCDTQLYPGYVPQRCPGCVLLPPLIRQTRFIWEYGGIPRDLIRTMKYRPSVWVARMCGDLLAHNINQLFGTQEWDLIIPVPSSRANYRKRLFHPCTEMARRIVTCCPGARLGENLVQARQRAPQATLSHEARLRRLRQMFQVKRASDLRGKRVLVVEDVITTGATSAAAAFALLQAGAIQVDIVALARTTVWSRFRRRLFELLQPPALKHY